MSNSIAISRSTVVHSQRGAALIVGLLLLVVLSLLAIAGINSASLEFIMAGNEQYKQNAFQTAESGIQYAANYALNNNQFVASNDTALSTFTGTDKAIAGTNDTFDYTITFIDKGTPLGDSSVSDNNNTTPLAAYHFQITSTGKTKVRGAQITNTQGVAINAQNDPTIKPDSCIAANCALTP